MESIGVRLKERKVQLKYSPHLKTTDALLTAPLLDTYNTQCLQQSVSTHTSSFRPTRRLITFSGRDPVRDGNYEMKHQSKLWVVS